MSSQIQATAHDPRYLAVLRSRIASRILTGSNGCWIWRWGRAKNGYGRMVAFTRDRYRENFAHRVSYRAFVDPSPIKFGWTIDHLCRNRPCVNPEHLEVVTIGENTRRGREARFASPIGGPLLGQRLRATRLRLGLTQASLAAELGIPRSTFVLYEYKPEVSPRFQRRDLILQWLAVHEAAA